MSRPRPEPEQRQPTMLRRLQNRPYRSGCRQNVRFPRRTGYRDVRRSSRNVRLKMSGLSLPFHRGRKRSSCSLSRSGFRCARGTRRRMRRPVLNGSRYTPCLRSMMIEPKPPSPAADMRPEVRLSVPMPGRSASTLFGNSSYSLLLLFARNETFPHSTALHRWVKVMFYSFPSHFLLWSWLWSRMNLHTKRPGPIIMRFFGIPAVSWRPYRLSAPPSRMV